jgi:hypothetical protein
MPKYVYIQTSTSDKPARIRADKTQETGKLGTPAYNLSIIKDDIQIGNFAGVGVVGWWIDDEESK